jgi:hypothetical protein
LDENGNFKIEHPRDATVGGTFILPTGTLKARIGSNLERTVGRNEHVSIGVDKTQNIGNDDTKSVGNQRKLTVAGDEIRILGANSTETVEGSKTIIIKGALSLQSGGSSSKLNLNDISGAIETDIFTVLAKEIILEAPVITAAGDLNILGTLKVNGPIMTNAAVVAPDLGKEHYSGTKGMAGTIPPKKAIKS